jgi:hypothetical protein
MSTSVRYSAVSNVGAGSTSHAVKLTGGPHQDYSTTAEFQMWISVATQARHIGILNQSRFLGMQLGVLPTDWHVGCGLALAEARGWVWTHYHLHRLVGILGPDT